jgi:hypothetical protein
MDVQLKRAYRQGYLGNAEAGYGTHERYLGRAFALRFTDNSRLTLFGGANNINDDNRPYNDGDWGSALDVNGEKKRSMAGGEHFWESPDKTFRNTLKALLENSRIDTETRTTSQTFLADGSTSYSRARDIARNKETNVNVNDYWQFTKKWWVSGNVSFNHSSNHGNASSGYVSSLTDMLLTDTLSSRSSEQYKEGHRNEVEVSSEATRKLAWGDEVAFEAKYRHVAAEHELYGKNLTALRQQPALSDYRQEYEKARQRDDLYSLKAKYTVPFLKGPAVSLSYNPKYRRATDHDNIFRLDRLNDWSASADKPLRLLPSMADMLASCIDTDNSYDYKDVATDHVIALDVSRQKYTEEGVQHNWDFNIPVTITHERMEYQRGRIDTTGVRNYAVLNPRLSYESVWNGEANSFRASTSYLTSVAAFQQIMPFYDNRNPLRVQESNPHLKHSWIYNYCCPVKLLLRGKN